MKLFDPVIDTAKQHKNFKSVLATWKEPERNKFIEWADGFPDRDGKFVRQFQETFNSCFWEIYLYAVFKEYGAIFDWKNTSPDFCMELKNQQFLVEAVTANSAQLKPNEWDRMLTKEELKDISFNELNKESIIRLSNSILSKCRIYDEKYSRLNHVKNKAFVIAVAPFEQPGFNLQYNRPIKALLYDYYVDEDEYLKNPERYPEGPPAKELGFIEKDNGAEIPLGIFMDDSLSQISAIIFSCTATWGKLNAIVDNADVHTEIYSIWATDPNGKPEKRIRSRNQHEESLTDGLQVYHNPFARYPLSDEIFRHRGVVQCFPDVENQVFLEEESTKCLHYRQVMNYRVNANNAIHRIP